MVMCPSVTATLADGHMFGVSPDEGPCPDYPNCAQPDRELRLVTIGAFAGWEFLPNYGGGRDRFENGSGKPLDAVVKRICNVLTSGAEAQHESVATESFELAGPTTVHEYAVAVRSPQMRRPVVEALLQL